MPLPERKRHIPTAWKEAVCQILRSGSVIATVRADSDWLELFPDVENMLQNRQEAFLAALETPGILGKKSICPLAKPGPFSLSIRG